MSRDECRKCKGIFHDEGFVTIRLCKNCFAKYVKVDKAVEFAIQKC